MLTVPFLSYNHPNSNSNAQVSDRRLELLVSALKLNRHVKRLYLSGNMITSKGAKALADVMAWHPSLEVVILEGNNIDSKGAKLIVKAVMSNANINDVQLGGNPTNGNEAWELRRWFRNSMLERSVSVTAYTKAVVAKKEMESPLFDMVASAGMFAALAGMTIWILKRKPADMGNRRVVWNR